MLVFIDDYSDLHSVSKVNKIDSSQEYIPKELYENSLQEIELLKQQLSELRRLIFGVKSERFMTIPQEQLSLFVDAQQQSIPSTEQINYTRNKKASKEKPVRQVLPAHLPRIEEIIEPTHLDQGAKKIGEEITEQLEYNPAQIFVRRIIRPKYTLPNEQGVVIAELPTLTLPKSNAGASMLAHIAVSKFVDHLPLYRQRQIFKRQQLDISDSTIGDWLAATCNLLQPLYDCLSKKVLQSSYLQMDESPIGVQDNHKKGSLHTGYQWVMHAPVERLILFQYDSSRSKNLPEKILENFSGTLQTDGYKVYQNLILKNQLTLLGCMAHARRYFEKALDNDSIRATYVLKEFQKLYAFEEKIRNRELDSLVIVRYRKLVAVPVLNNLELWLKQNIYEVLPKSAIGKAIAYTLNIWSNLIRYIENGDYLIDNNRIENAIRPLALGRKNYLFAGSHSSAQNTAMMYSFFATCKINHIEPLAWLTNVLNKIPDQKVNSLEELLPINHES